MTTFRHHVEYLTVLALGYAMRPLPRRSRLALGRTLGSIVFSVDKKHQAVTIKNLNTAFDSTKSAEEKYAIARGTFRHFGAMLFELLALGKPSRRKIEKIVEFEGLENYERARAAGRGVLLVAAHFGNWEIHAIAHAYRLGPIAVVARLQDNPHYNRWLEDIRTVSSNTVLYKQRALARMLRMLRDGETVAVLVDQNVSTEDAIFVDFFGRQAATTPVVAWLAAKTGAALVPVFTLPLTDGRYRLIYETPIDPSPYVSYRGSERRRVIQDLTQQCVGVLEGYVRRNPEYWLWMHRRWKTRPPEEREARDAQIREGAAS